jgi:hypothetical protein
MSLTYFNFLLSYLLCSSSEPRGLAITVKYFDCEVEKLEEYWLEDGIAKLLGYYLVPTYCFADFAVF